MDTPFEVMEVAGRSIVVRDGRPMLAKLRMRPPEDGEAFGSEIEAVMEMSIPNPRALVESLLAGVDPDEAPEEIREGVAEALEHAKEQLAELDNDFEVGVPLPYGDGNGIVFKLGMN